MHMNVAVAYFPDQWPLAAMTDGGERAPMQRASASGQAALAGLNILVVEDESLIALLLIDALEEAGANVVGPCYTLTECMRLARTEAMDGAILDVDLAGQDVFPAADELRRRNVPFIFHTAHADRDELKARYRDVHVCRKPSHMNYLVTMLADITNPKARN